MTNEESAAAAEVPTPEEVRLFEFLERYLDSLHSGDVVSRSVLIERHPELAKCVRCIELLDRLAPERPAAKTTEASVQPATPQAFCKYELLEEIGRGGMGVVF